MNKTKLQNTVASIIKQIRRKGDQALFGYTRKFDGIKLNRKSVRVTQSDMNRAYKRCPKDRRQVLEACARRIAEFHRNEKNNLPRSWNVNKGGVRLGQIFSPIDSVGIYVPGGRFSYPSTVLMTAIPARLAGVRRRVVVTPPGRLTDEILTAAKIAGVTELYRVGGPAGLAAVALGTKSIAQVDLIIGPGNALVTEAKRQLFGEVGIDLLAGPSELVVVADNTAVPSFVAADLGAQAEHDPDATGILISTSRSFIQKVKKQVPRAVKKQCRFYYLSSLNKALELANTFAGEHVQLMVRQPKKYLKKLKNGGAIFIQPWSTAVMGDYWAGPSHVLPTGRSARFISGLSVLSFYKRSSLIQISAAAFKKGWKKAYKMAEMEGLTLHGKSISTRGKYIR